MEFKELGPAKKSTKFKLVSAKDLYNKIIPPILMLIDSILAEESLVILAGMPGSFKTGIALLLAICGAGYSEFLSFKVNKKFNTLFIDEENGMRRTKFKLKRLCDGLKIVPPEGIFFSSMAGFKLERVWIEDLKNQIKQYSINVVVIDNIARCMVGSERDEKDVSKIHDLLKPLAEELGVTILYLHHLRKTDFKNHHPKTLEDISGSRDFGAQCDDAYIVDFFSRKGNTKTFKLMQVKAKDSIEMPGINFTVTGDPKIENDPLIVNFSGLIEENVEERKREDQLKIMEWWDSNGSLFQKTAIVIEAFKGEIGRDRVREALRLLAKDEILYPSNGGYSWRKNE